jgi:outer membrane usher protein
VRFEAPRLRAFTGRVRVARGGPTEIPRFGTLTLDTGEGRAESPIGRDGEVYLDAVPPGRHPATIESEEGRCRFELTIPDATSALTDLGLLTCQAGPEARR